MQKTQVIQIRCPIKVDSPQAHVQAGEYFVTERGDGFVDGVYLAATDMVKLSPRRYQGNAEHILRISKPVDDAKYRGTWDIFDGGKIRPATTDELVLFRDELYRKLGEVVMKLKEKR